MAASCSERRHRWVHLPCSKEPGLGARWPVCFPPHQLCDLRQATHSLSLDLHFEVIAEIITSSRVVMGARQPRNVLSTWHLPDGISANQLLLVFAGPEGGGMVEWEEHRASLG